MSTGALILPAAAIVGCAPSSAPSDSGHPTFTASPSAKACTPAWSTSAIPLPSGTQPGGEGNPSFAVASIHTIQSLSADSASDIWAVGQTTGPDNAGVALAEHWDGQTWVLVPVMHAGNSRMAYDYSEDLTSVDAVSPANVWAVGFYPSKAAVSDTPSTVENSTLIEHWNGTAWSIVAAPDASPSDYLYGISADSSNDIWAVGSATYSIPLSSNTSTDNVPLLFDAPLVEHWNGSSWKIVPAPTLGLDPHNAAAIAQAKAAALGASPLNIASADFTSVRAISPDNVWAVGIVSFEDTGSGPYGEDETLTEHWNGSRWSIVPAPDVTVTETKSAAGDDLDALSGSADDLWAVGRAQPVGTLVLHWNGTAWVVAPSPQTGENGYLETVLDLGTGNVWATGDEIDHWDGSAWTQMATVNGASYAPITAIAATAADNVWFAGETQFLHYGCQPAS